MANAMCIGNDAAIVGDTANADTRKNQRYQCPTATSTTNAVTMATRYHDNEDEDYDDEEN